MLGADIGANHIEFIFDTIVCAVADEDQDEIVVGFGGGGDLLEVGEKFGAGGVFAGKGVNVDSGA